MEFETAEGTIFEIYEIYQPPGRAFNLCVTCNLNPLEMREMEIEVRKVLPSTKNPELEWILVWNTSIAPYSETDDGRWVYFFKALNPESVEEFNKRLYRISITDGEVPGWIWAITYAITAGTILFAIILLARLLLQ